MLRSLRYSYDRDIGHLQRQLSLSINRDLLIDEFLVIFFDKLYLHVWGWELWIMSDKWTSEEIEASVIA